MPVAAASSDSLQIELTLPVACGSGSHDVAFLVTAWGDVRVAFDPCSVLPPLARQFAGGSCGPHVQRCCAVMQQYLQHVWTEDEPSGLDGSLNAADQKRLRELLVKARHRKHAVVDARHVPLSGESAPSDVRWQLSEDPAALWESIIRAGGCRDWRTNQAILDSWDDLPFWCQLAASSVWNEALYPPCVPLLRAWLTDDRVIRVLRAHFAETVGRLGDLRDVDSLTDASLDSSVEVASAAQGALALLLERLANDGPNGERDLLTALTSILGDPDERRRAAGVEFLSRVGGPFVPQLARTLQSRGAPARAAAAEVLERLNAWTAVEPLLDLLWAESEFIVAARAAHAVVSLLPGLCGSLPEVACVPGPQPPLPDGDSGPLGLLYRALRIPNTLVNAGAAAVLGERKRRDAVEPLLELLGSRRDPAARAAAARALGQIGDSRAAAPLIAALNAYNSELKQAASPALLAVVQALPADRSSEAILLRALRVPHVALASVLKIAEFDISARIPLLIQALASGDENVQAAAIELLRRTADTRALEALLRVMSRCGQKLRDRVADATINLVRDTCGQVPTNLPLLEHALAAPHIEVALEAARALKLIADPRSAPALFRACLRGNVALSTVASAALLRIAGPSVIEPLGRVLGDGDDRMAHGACAALIAIGRPSVPVLKRALKWRYSRARILAATALGQIGDLTAIETLRSAEKDHDPNVASAVRAALDSLQRVTFLPKRP